MSKWTGTSSRIQRYFGPETRETLRMEQDGIVFTLVPIHPDDRENMQKFEPYCCGSVVWKYGVIWKAGCLEDRYVFDTRAYAVEFIVMSCQLGV